MKTLKNIILLGVLSVLVFSSCEIPLALGPKLDLEGPVVTISSPAPRKAVPAVFTLEGKATDYSGVERLLITTSVNNTPFSKQWRYVNGAWEISADNGANWQPYKDAQWSGTKNSVDWAVQIDLNILDRTLEDGEYTFAVQAWDSGNLSDDNSYRTIVLIIDQDPPKVAIVSPYLYDRNSYDRDTDTFTEPLNGLHVIPDDSDIRKDPLYLGKFITQEFPLQWQIDDNHDVWSIELFLYEYNAIIDGYPETSLPSGYIYRYFENLPPVPENPDPENYIKPNGSIEVPALDRDQGNYRGGRLENPISGKTTIMVVAVCYDAAGNANQEKKLGYFVYWPLANEPFIIYPGAMQQYEPDYYYDKSIADIEPELYMIYPGKSIKANAFHPHGVEKVVYSVYKLNDAGDIITKPAELEPVAGMADEEKKNSPRPNGDYSTGYTWEVKPLSRSGFYLIEAYAYDAKGDRNNDAYAAVFRVQDITFPDFFGSPEPSASDPLFKSIDTVNNTITIKGIVTDTMEITSLKMVWINPSSRNYAAMSQLAYFRDVNYAGWAMAPATPGDFAFENIYGLQQNPPDTSSPNKVWNVPLITDLGFQEDNRRHYEYSLTINLATHLGIGRAAGQQPLNSQVFLLRAENPDNKCTVITYAPQGDTVTPSLKINQVTITNTIGGKNITCTPGVYSVIEKFADGDVITIKGTWDEDSTSVLNIQDYLKPNFIVTVNGFSLSEANIVLDPDTGTAPYGTDKPWTATMTVGAATMTADSLKDTLVIAAQVHDIGGNAIETGSSWLIESDHLRLLRISSEEQDDTYTTGTPLKIFLEFSKPVRLISGGSTARPQLILNSATGNTAIATYVPNINQSSRQYFEYTVSGGENTPASTALNVRGLLNAGTWSTANYPFTWYRGTKDELEYEEIRVTNVAAHTGEDKITGYDFYARNLPVTTTATDSDYQFTLIAGKQIFIDTAQPNVTEIRSNTNTGWYSTGTEIYFTVRFNEPVKISGTPVLNLNVANGASASSPTGSAPANVNDVRVDGNDIIFVYKVKAGDTTNGNVTRVNSIQNGSVITDLAGNAISGNISGDINGIYVETLTPGTPTVRVLSANNVNNVASNNLGTGISGTADINIRNLYNENLWLAIQGNTTTPSGAHKLSYLEYSIDDGKNWVRAPNTANTPFELTRTGNYEIKARQIDRAGNPSAETRRVSFIWDKGALVTRISSTLSNGTYPKGQLIPITVAFRKNLTFTGSPQVQLNARTGANATISAGVTGSLTGVTTLTFNYTVADGHTIPTNGGNLDVTSFTGITATDALGVTVTSMIVLPTQTDALLGNNKQIKIDTRDLTVTTAPAFTGGTGIQTDDGSYWTNLEIVFSKPIYKGDGNITITQNAGTTTTTYYRLPIVMTEAQYNRFSVAAGLSTIDTYYTRETNGYINGQGSDTTPKYVLKYQYDPNSGNTSVPSAFVSSFRTAESVTINVAASIVSIINNNTLRVRLEGSNAPQVPGATYTVSYPEGLVRDALDNACPDATNTAAYANVSLGGVAKPFVRIQKTQDRITTATASATQPRLVAVQPFNAYARMETRTPGAEVRHVVTDSRTTTTGNANGTAGSNNNWSPTGNPSDTNTPVLNRPETPGTGSTLYNNPITLGNNADNTVPTIATVQGYRWWVRAIAVKSGVNSYEAEEIAYRTVITYQLRNGTGAINSNPGNGHANLANGDQIWIRGGDAIGSSSVPGFPFTWEDTWTGTSLAGKRAGIRLMTKTNNTDQLNNSLWRFVTWDINTTAYVDMIMGHDVAGTEGDVTYTLSPADVAWQYGPKRWAYQRAGWTSFKERYPIYPGKHRWLDTSEQWESKGEMNFSATFSARPDFTVTNGVTMPTP